MMRAVQMTLEEDLVAAVDKAAKKLETTRSAFTRKAGLALCIGVLGINESSR